MLNEQRLWVKDRFESDAAYDVIVWNTLDTIPAFRQPYETVYHDSTVVVLFRKNK
jgi:hypothetical protein